MDYKEQQKVTNIFKIYRRQIKNTRVTDKKKRQCLFLGYDVRVGVMPAQTDLYPFIYVSTI